MTGRQFQYENQLVNVFKTTIVRDQPLNIEYHDKARTIVALSGGTITAIFDNGDTFDMSFETGKAYWFEKDPLDSPKGFIVNHSDIAVELMVIEVKLG